MCKLDEDLAEEIRDAVLPILLKWLNRHDESEYSFQPEDVKCSTRHIMDGDDEESVASGYLELLDEQEIADWTARINDDDLSVIFIVYEYDGNVELIVPHPNHKVAKDAKVQITRVALETAPDAEVSRRTGTDNHDEDDRKL